MRARSAAVRRRGSVAQAQRWTVATSPEDNLLTAEQGWRRAAIHPFRNGARARGARVLVQPQRPSHVLLATVPRCRGVCVVGDAFLAATFLPAAARSGAARIDATHIPANVPYLTVDEPRRQSAATEVARSGRSLACRLAWAGASPTRTTPAFASVDGARTVAGSSRHRLVLVAESPPEEEIAANSPGTVAHSTCERATISTAPPAGRRLDLIVTGRHEHRASRAALAKPTWDPAAVRRRLALG